MMTSHDLRQFTRWVALWFAISLGVAVASPLIKPHAMSLICSGLGVMKVIVQTDDGAAELGSHTLDCPLCANLAAPPPTVPLLAQPKPEPACTQQVAQTPHRPSQPHEPWQARAPPVLS